MIRIICNILLLIFFCNLIHAQDTQPPLSPDVRGVSVLPGQGSVRVQWWPSVSSDVWGYLVYRNEGSESSPLWIAAGDTVPYADATEFVDIAAEANLHSESYRVIAIDSARNTSLMSEMHSTMYAFPYLNDDECPAHIYLNWNDYVGWESDPEYYVVYAQEYPGTFVVVDTVDVSEWYDYNIVDSTKYCFYVEAHYSDGQKIAVSNTSCGVTELYNLPDFLNLNYVSIADYYLAKISFTIDTNTKAIKHYSLLKRKPGEEFDTLISLPPPPGSEVIYYDSIENEAGIYTYKVAAIDACGNNVIESNQGNTIFLEAKSTDNMEIKLSWNRYREWQGVLKETNIYRMKDGGPPEKILTIDYDDTLYVDHLDDVWDASFGNFCYYIEVIEDQNPYYYGAYSRSGLACASQSGFVFVPTAFTPGDATNGNNVYSFSVPFVSEIDFYFAIYNRWGQICYETNNIPVQWDGTLKSGKLAPMGVYSYYLRYTDSSAKRHEKHGYITIIR